MRRRSTLRGSLISAAFLFSLHGAASAQIVYVDASATGANDGTSWTNAFLKLQDALRFVRMTNAREVWVADGVYFPDEGIGVALNNRDAAFTLDRDGTQLYGGFAGGETLRTQRNPAVNIALLNGDLAENDAPGFVNRAENSRHIIWVANNVSVRVDGFTIRGGFADFPADNVSNRGGGLIALNGATTAIANCIFTDNHASEYGGAAFFFAQAGSPGVSLRTTTFQGNRSSVAGGAVYFFATGIKAIASCSFLRNTTGGGGGGAISGDVSNLTMVNGVFIDNSAGSSGGIGTGGAIGCGGGPPTRIINSTFAANRTSGRGGAGISLTASNAAPTISNSIFWGNRDNAGTDERAQIDRLFSFGTQATVQYSIVQGLSGSPPFISGSGNSAADPMFVDLDGANNVVGDTDDNVRLSPGSPAINAGDASLRPADTLDLDSDGNTVELVPVDRDGAERVQCDFIDMGAYESADGAGNVQITCPPTATVECGGNTNPTHTGTATATGCGNITIGYVDTIAPGECPAEYAITRTWTASNSSASASCDQTIHVVDSTPPALTLPADASVECGQSVDPADTGAASANDACDTAPVVEYSDQVTPGACPQQATIARTWTATDACGNVASGVQTITVSDTMAPIIDFPADVTVSCTASTEPSATGTATAFDACDADPNVTYFDDPEPGDCPAESVLTRVWIARDACGNTAFEFQTITVVDDSPPTLVVPQDITIACGDSTDTSLTGSASAWDSCDASPMITFLDETSVGECPEVSVVTRIWTATDACGNSASGSQRIALVDTVAPSIVCPIDIDADVEAGACDVAGLDLGFAIATDNCSQVFVTNNAPAVFPVGTTFVTWTATDACGLTSSCTQRVTVADATPPTITCSLGTTMLWPPNHDLINVGLGVTISDDCGTGGTTTVRVYADEDDQEPTGDGNHSPDAKNHAPGALRLRSERMGTGNGRVYLIVIEATDGSGNLARTCCTVVVPHSRNNAGLLSVMNQAAAAEAFCRLTGNAPPGYVLVGDGPIIGPKQ